MKKYLIPALALGLVMTSCQSDEPFAPGEGGEKQVTFTLNVPGELGTRAGEAYNSGVGGLSNNAGELSYTLVLDADGDQRTFTQKGAGSVVFNPTVVLGRNYTVTAYAHFGNAWDGKTAIDITKHFNDETKDAYFKQENIKFELNETSKQITLKRPFGKLRLLATDYTAAGTQLNTAVESVIIEYLDINASKFNPITGLFDDNGVYTNLTTPQTFGYYAAEEDGAMPIFADYIPANSEDNMVDFKVTVKYLNSDETYSRTFNDIPVRRNALTTLKGNFFTASAEITVNVEDNFDNFIPGEGNAEEQLRMAAIMGGSYTLPCDVTLSKPLKVEADMTLNLNGKTITAALEEEGRHHYAILNNANLVLEGEGTINARGIKNFGEMTINGNVTITNIDTNGGAAVWNEGKLTINNGTFTTNDQAGEGSYGAALNTRAGGEAVVNGGRFEAYSQLTYAIVNEGKTTINNATVKGKHGAVAGAESNDQTTINGGSFELMENPGVSDHCAYCVSDIKGGSFTLGNNTDSGAQVFCESTIADGYKAIAKDSKYYVVPAEAEAVATTTSELNDALANGDDVVLFSDIAVAKSDAGSNGYGATGISQLNGGVIDGNGNDLSVNAWGTWDSALNTTGGTIKNLNVTGGMRGIFVNHNSTNNSKVILENVVIDGTVYTISCDQGTNQGLEATNSTFNGWTSYATTIGNVKFTNCSFGEGQGYAFCRPYASTTFVGCNFAAGYEIDARATVTFENCTINGVALTEANLATLVTSNTANATVK